MAIAVTAKPACGNTKSNKKSGTLSKIRRAAQQLTIRLKEHSAPDNKKKPEQQADKPRTSILSLPPWGPEPEDEEVDMAAQRVLRRDAVQAVTASLQQCQGLGSFARDGSTMGLYPVQPQVQAQVQTQVQATVQTPAAPRRAPRPQSFHQRQAVPPRAPAMDARRHSWSPAWSVEVEPLFAPPQSRHARISSPYDVAAQSLRHKVAYEEKAPEPDSDNESDYGDDDEDDDDDEIYLAQPVCAWK